MNISKQLIIIPFYLLAACAPHHPVGGLEEPQSTASKQPTGKAQSISSWKMRGALAAKNKTKGWSAAMNWEQNGPSTYQIRLMGPLGNGAVLINKKGNTITYQEGSKKITSQNPNELLKRQTGISLPVANLYYWVRGLPAPGPVGSENRDASNHLTQLHQSGYTITFAKYTSVKGTDLPSAIRLEGNGVMIKVTIQNWTV